MRIEGSVTTISWIPSEAVTGAVFRVPFEVGLSHYDDPPPDTIDDVAAYVAADRCRFANTLSAWAEVEDGEITRYGQTGMGRIGATTLRLGGQAMVFAAVALPDRQRAEQVSPTQVRFEQTAGGRTGVPAPRRVSRPPYLQLAAPLAWTTLSVTLTADGSVDTALQGASVFPRHWVYDGQGRLTAKSAVIDYAEWSTKAFGRHSPWGDEDSPALVAEVETALERELSREIMAGGQRPQIRRLDRGQLLTEQGDVGDDLYLLLDGVLDVEVDGEAIAEVGPGAVLGERAILEQGRRTSTLKAVTRCTVAVADRSSVDVDKLRRVAEGHRREGGDGETSGGRGEATGRES
jgi:hypothetical protein